MQLKFAAPRGHLQVARQRAAGACGVVHLALILADQAALLALAPVHRELGVAEHLVALRRVDREDREADRGGEADLLVVDLEGLREHAGDAFGKRLGVLRVIARCLQSEKLVAALAGQKLGRPQHPPHPVGDLDQQEIAGAMAEQIVDVLEAVEIDRKRRELVGFLMGLGGVERQPFVEGDAVRQAGHGVVERELMDPVGRFRAQLEVDDVGREAGTHHQQHGADRGEAEDMRGYQIAGKHHRRIGNSRGRGRQRVVHRTDHEGQHDRRAMAAPARHRPVGAVDRERREAEAEQEGHDDAEDVPVEVACDMPASEGDEMHGKDACAHHEASRLRGQRKMAAADLEADQTGDDGDEREPRRLRPARSLN